MLYEELRIIEEELKRIKNMGYIKNIRKKREGELATFLSLLNNKNICHKIDIKLKKDFTKKYITIFNANIEPQKENEIKRLKDKYGFLSNNIKKDKIFKLSVQANYSTQAENKYLFKLILDYKKEKLFLAVYDHHFNLKECKAGWDFSYLESIYKKKSPYLILIKVWEQTIDKVKHYKFYDYYIWKLKSFNEFLKLIEDGTIRVTFKIDIYKKGPKKGEICNRGIVFEIQELELNKLYDK